jgi:ATP-dependent HslUV protease ATP-binding subunit HslU
MDLTPRQVVAHLDRYVVGQPEAKRAVAVAIRNRIRRQRLDAALARDVLPKNLILSGPTGVGKTEIARRMASLLQAPFLKVEATKYTEVGYYGRDVETIARDLVETGVQLVKVEERERVKARAREVAEERLLDLVLGETDSFPFDEEERAEARRRREEARGKLRAGAYEEERVTLSLEDRSTTSMEVFSAMGVEQMGVDMQGFLDRVAPPRMVERTIPVARARQLLEMREGEALLDHETIVREAIRRVEESGIVFLDELDKVVAAEGAQGPDVSRGGVQRDLLPLVEGCTVQTRYGPVRTDHVLFIAAGAFHHASPEDLMPELQGRFPLRVSLQPLSADDFARILTEPEHALTKQYRALLGTDGVEITFTDDGVDEIAALAQRLNSEKGDLGARRLHTVLERLLEPVSYGAPEEAGPVRVDSAYVLQRVQAISEA